MIHSDEHRYLWYAFQARDKPDARVHWYYGGDTEATTIPFDGTLVSEVGLFMRRNDVARLTIDRGGEMVSIFQLRTTRGSDLDYEPDVRNRG